MRDGVGEQGISACVEYDEAERRVERVKREVGFGKRLQQLVARSGVPVTRVASALGKGRGDVYELFRGESHLRAACLEMLPAAVELLYLAERAAHHGRELRVAGDAEDASAPRSLLDIVNALTGAMRAAAEGEADNALTPDEIERELQAWERVDSVRWARVAFLERAKAQRGVVLLSKARTA